MGWVGREGRDHARGGWEGLPSLVAKYQFDGSTQRFVALIPHTSIHIYIFVFFLWDDEVEGRKGGSRGEDCLGPTLALSVGPHLSTTPIKTLTLSRRFSFLLVRPSRWRANKQLLTDYFRAR